MFELVLCGFIDPSVSMCEYVWMDAFLLFSRNSLWWMRHFYVCSFFFFCLKFIFVFFRFLRSFVFVLEGFFISNFFFGKVSTSYVRSRITHASSATNQPKFLAPTPKKRMLLF